MTEQEIRSHLRTQVIGQTIFIFDTIDSTNTQAKALAEKGVPDGSLIIAEEQSGGRGRLGRSWTSNRGESLTFSIIVKPKIPVTSLGIISLIGGLAVAEAIRECTYLLPGLKWPNDVLVDGKKCCGVLSESVLNRKDLAAVVIGIGLNVNQKHFDPDLASIATSLSIAADGNQFNRFQILGSILSNLELLYEEMRQGRSREVLNRWKANSRMFGKQIAVGQHGVVLKGIAKRLADDGGLIISTDDGEQTVHAGDVTIINH